ncbi:hypothetical protein DSM112329_01788 [Paraconexibacter sp. AEG42_29]|uniref:Uncharacterized protein n=1 Tax=Paraconexibacter sp. AEG42_29 TaxID=2997339 RepID=A0AAU7ATC4_9ACTN
MTTFAADEHTGPPARAAREREAWAHYADTLRELGPVAYAAAEPPAWEHLQEALAELGPVAAPASP